MIAGIEVVYYYLLTWVLLIFLPLKNYLFTFMFTGVLPVCMSVRMSDIGVIDNSELPCGCWDLNLFSSALSHLQSTCTALYQKSSPDGR